MPIAVEAVPKKVIAELSAAALDALEFPTPAATGIIAGEIGQTVVVAPAPTTNCCNCDDTALVSGCTANTPAMVKTSPADGAPVPVSTFSVPPVCVAPFVR